MSENDHVLGSADAVAPRQAEARILAEVERVWQTEDGPPCGYCSWEYGPVLNPGPLQYRNVAIAPYVVIKSGADEVDPSLVFTALETWCARAVCQLAMTMLSHGDDGATIGTPSGKLKSLTVTPDTHKVVWRIRPEFIRDDIRKSWTIGMRLAFAPKGAVLLPLED